METSCSLTNLFLQEVLVSKAQSTDDQKKSKPDIMLGIDFKQSHFTVNDHPELKKFINAGLTIANVEAEDSQSFVIGRVNGWKLLPDIICHRDEIQDGTVVVRLTEDSDELVIQNHIDLEQRLLVVHEETLNTICSATGLERSQILAIMPSNL